MAKLDVASAPAKALSLSACVLIAGLLAGCDGSAGPYPGVSAPPATNASMTASSAMDPRFQDVGGAESASTAIYQIGPADVLGIAVFQVPELNTDVQVSAEGTIVLPLVGSFNVLGKQAQDVEREITAKLRAKYMQQPQVTVSIKAYNSQKIVVSGAVTSPGTIAMTGGTTLVSAIADAKGFNDVADQHTIVVFRQTNGQKYAAKFDFDQVQQGKVPDPPLQKGDVVVVDTSDLKYGLKTYLPIAAMGTVFTRL